MGGCVGRYWEGWEDTQSRGSSRNGGRGGRNEPLKKDRPKWKSDYPMTEGQLRSKRDEFWDTAPAFEGRKEIWDALKAAAVALEFNDHELAQAICYDELGNRYQLPVYCLAPPVNLISERSDDDPSDSPDTPVAPKKDASMGDTIGLLKKQLQAQEDIDSAHQRWFFSGKLLTDKTRLQDTKIQKDFVIQVIVKPQALRAPKLPATTSSP
ncbi:hypothetical protein FQN60_002764, partial [Etheostoma spectabile]